MESYPASLLGKHDRRRADPSSPGVRALHTMFDGGFGVRRFADTPFYIAMSCSLRSARTVIVARSSGVEFGR
jgi:hypothetical protein